MDGSEYTELFRVCSKGMMKVEKKKDKKNTVVQVVDLGKAVSLFANIESAVVVPPLQLTFSTSVPVEASTTP